MENPVVVVDGRSTRRRLVVHPSSYHTYVLGAQESSLDRGEPLRFADAVVIDEGDNLVRRALDDHVARSRNVRALEELVLNRQALAKPFQNFIGRSHLPRQ